MKNEEECEEQLFQVVNPIFMYKELKEIAKALSPEQEVLFEERKFLLTASTEKLRKCIADGKKFQDKYAPIIIHRRELDLQAAPWF